MNSRTDWRNRARSPLEVRESEEEAIALDAQQAGALAQLDRNRMLARPISIFEITPDPCQPRRAVPAKVRAWTWGTGMPNLFDQWVFHASRETEDADVMPYIRDMVLDCGEETHPIQADGPALAALLDLAGLAMSIRRDGLANPITVASQSDGYLIETGERRWLAFHLLHWLTGDTRWSKIPARVVTFDVWRQASENNARANLNAIGKARQFAILLMDLLRARGEGFAPFESFDREQDYYAQVADGEAHRIPRGQSEKLLNALGLKNPQQLRQCRALLSLESQIWTAADDANWSLTNLTEYLKTGKKPDSDGYTVLINTVSPENGAKTPVGEGERATNVAPNISQIESPAPPAETGAEVILPGGQRGIVEGTVGAQAVRVRTARGTRVERKTRVRTPNAHNGGMIYLADVVAAVERLYAALANETNSMAGADVDLLRRFAGDVERWLEKT